MTENYKNNADASSPNLADVPAQIQKIQQHLIFLEKKLDTLIAGQAQAQTQKSSFPRKDFSRPRRVFGQTEGQFSRDRKPEGRRGFQDRGRTERGFGGQQRFGGGDRPHRPERSERSGRDEVSDRPQRREGFHGPKKKFFGGKKPFPRRDRD